MSAKAIMFGGIGTLVETSELQRQAFNEAFREAGIPWKWDVPTYRQLLAIPGGKARIRYFDSTRPDTDLSEDQVAAIHARKSSIFQERLVPGAYQPRPGVRKLIEWAKRLDLNVALASTTSKANIEALAAASGIDLGRFDVVLHDAAVPEPKPSPAVYLVCLEALRLTADEAVAIEDSPSGIAAAVAAGVDCIAVPGRYTKELDFRGAAFIALYSDMHSIRAFIRDPDR